MDYTGRLGGREARLDGGARGDVAVVVCYARVGGTVAVGA